MAVSINWTCPFCSRSQVVVDRMYDRQHHHLEVYPANSETYGVILTAIACANKDCSAVSLNADFAIEKLGHSGYQPKDVLQTWRLRPESVAKPQPEFIPAPLRQDYVEACRICHLSPNASATLSRRCLQGMIRDFCGISKNTLFQEIQELKDRVDAGTAPPGVTLESVEAIDHVRTIGNIGAHMNKDVNLIIDIDPNEAEALIGLIEMLFAEWYSARETRRARLDELRRIAEVKKPN